MKATTPLSANDASTTVFSPKLQSLRQHQQQQQQQQQQQSSLAHSSASSSAGTASAKQTSEFTPVWHILSPPPHLFSESRSHTLAYTLLETPRQSRCSTVPRPLGSCGWQDPLQCLPCPRSRLAGRVPLRPQAPQRQECTSKGLRQGPGRTSRRAGLREYSSWRVKWRCLLTQTTCIAVSGLP